MLTASEWPTNTGTRTQVAVSLILGSRIFLVSTTIFHSSLVEPSSMKTSICGMTLKAICLVNLLRRGAVVDEDALGLGPELVDAFLAGAGDRLVGRDDDALDRGEVVQRLQRHHQLRRRAVGVGDDVLAVVARHVGVEHVRVDLGHDQRHVGVVAPEARIIDDDAAGARRSSRHIPWRRPSRPTSARNRRR